jgi:hypothetical protein
VRAPVTSSSAGPAGTGRHHGFGAALLCGHGRPVGSDCPACATDVEAQDYRDALQGTAA